MDGVVIGEGEVTFREVIRRLQDRQELSGIAGLIIRKGDDVIIGPLRHRIKNLDALPNPRYSDINLHLYDGITIITSRGCSYKCSFCDVAPMWQHKVIFRSLDSVMDEIRILRNQYGQKIMRIVDDTFVINRSRVIEFCHRIMNEHLSVKWITSGRINLMDDELIDLMSRAGLERIFFGIESGSDRILKTINKGFNRSDVKRVIAKASKFFNISASFIWGFPDETLNDFLCTVDLLTYCASMGAQCQLIALSPLAQSEICAKYRDKLLPPRFRSVCGWGAIGHLAGENGCNVPSEVNALIHKHPDLFPGFYHVPTPDLERKIVILKQLGFQDSRL